MSERDHHIPSDRLTALAYAGALAADASPDAGGDTWALAHLGKCAQCSAAFSRLAADADAVRALAFAEADRVFDDGMLDAQRTRILDRLAHVGQAARVLAFPSPQRDASMPVTGANRRWVSVAAAAGLIVGLVAGQMLHFVPLPDGERDAPVLTARPGDEPRRSLPATTSSPALSEEELLEEVDDAIQIRRVTALRAIDALTPTAADLLAMGGSGR